MKYQVWYMLPEYFRIGMLGLHTPDPRNLTRTHVLLKELDTDGGLEAVFGEMQAEVWSPLGQARSLIESKNLQHTSMSVGDVIVDDVGNGHVVNIRGFRAIGGVR